MKLSLVLPCYNAEGNLAACLDSLCRQSYENWECICVDDGSIDGSGELLDRYATRDSRFRVVHTGNGGVSAARNRGISLSRGDYVGFVDADDTMDPTWLQGAVDSIEKSGADLVRLEPLEKSCQNVVTARKCLQCGFAWLNFVRADVLKRMRNPFPVGMRLREDTIFLLRVLSLAKTTYQIFLPGYQYRTNRTSSVYSEQRVVDFVRFVDELRAVHVPLSRRDASIAIYKSFLWWRTQRGRFERECVRLAEDALSRAERQALFSRRYTPLLWWRGVVLADAYIWLRRAVNPKWLP